MNARRLAALVAVSLAACYPTTTRPAVAPLQEARQLELELFIPEATVYLATALDADSIPVARTERNDGWLETDWFDAASLRPTDRRPVGPDVVKLRAWVDPGRPNHSIITMEIVYRPYDDPSRPGRVLERQVPDSHAVARRVAAVLKKLQGAYGEPDSTQQ